MKNILAFLRAFEPLILQGFDAGLIPELEQLASQAGSPDVKVVLGALIGAMKAIGDAEIPKV